MNLHHKLRLDKPTPSMAVFRPPNAGTYYVGVYSTTSEGSWELLTIGGYGVTLK